MPVRVLNWFQDIQRHYEATVVETATVLGPDAALVFVGFANDAIDIALAVPDAYDREELLHSLVNFDFHATHARIVRMQYDFISGGYEAVRWALRFTWESIFRAYFVDRFAEMNSRIPNPPGPTLGEKATWQPDRPRSLNWKTVILPVFRSLYPARSQESLREAFEPVWKRLNAAVHPSGEWRESGVEESARHVWPHFDEAQARELVADSRVVFAVVFAAMLRRFPKLAHALAVKPHTFEECPAARTFLPSVPPAASPT
jgi:hypothetical protein